MLPLGTPGEESVSLLFPASRGCPNSLVRGSFLRLQDQSCWAFEPLSDLPSCLPLSLTGTPEIIFRALLQSLGSSPYLTAPSSTTAAESFVLSKETGSRSGIRMQTSSGAIILPAAMQFSRVVAGLLF